MKRKLFAIVKNVFCIITIVWSATMLAEYLLVLLPFSLNGILFEIFDFFLIFLYAGILGVPIMFILSTIFMAIGRERFKATDSGAKINTVTVALPIITFALMLITDFNARMQ